MAGEEGGYGGVEATGGGGEGEVVDVRVGGRESGGGVCEDGEDGKKGGRPRMEEGHERRYL